MECWRTSIFQGETRGHRPKNAARIIAVVACVPVAARASTGAISGSVWDEKYFFPVDRVCVEVHTVGTPGSEPVVAGSAVTDGDGLYRIDGLTPGAYKVLFKECDWVGVFGRDLYESQWYQDKANYDQADPVLVATETAGVNAAMRRYGWISGHVTDSNGAPIGGVCARAHGSTGTSERAITDANGRYVLSPLRASNWKVSFADCVSGGVFEWYADSADEPAATPVVVANDTETAGVDVSLSLTAFSGLVTDSTGNAANQVCVEATDRGGRVLARTETIGSRYLLVLPGTGKYRVHFVDCHALGFVGEWYEDETAINQATILRVRQAGVVNGIDAVLTRS